MFTLSYRSICVKITQTTKGSTFLLVSIIILCQLYSPRYTAVQIKNCSKNVSVIYEKCKSCHMPQLLSWNWSIHYPSLSAMFNLLLSRMNQESFEKYLCYQGNHYEKHIWFPLHKGSHHMQPYVLRYTNRHLYRAEVMLNSGNIKLIALTVIKLHWSDSFQAVG